MMIIMMNQADQAGPDNQDDQNYHYDQDNEHDWCDQQLHITEGYPKVYFQRSLIITWTLEQFQLLWLFKH